jgi:hypothetical protein
VYQQLAKPGIKNHDLLTVVLGNVMHQDQQEQRKIVALLIEDIKQLSTKPDMEFVQKILVPLLNSYKSVEVCLNIWDSSD